MENGSNMVPQLYYESGHVNVGGAYLRLNKVSAVRFAMKMFMFLCDLHIVGAFVCARMRLSDYSR